MPGARDPARAGLAAHHRGDRRLPARVPGHALPRLPLQRRAHPGGDARAGGLGRLDGALERRSEQRLHRRDDARRDGRPARGVRAPDRRRRRRRSRSPTTPAGPRTSPSASLPSDRATSSSTRARTRRAPTRGTPAATARCGSCRPTACADAAAALAERIDADTVAVCITHVAPFTGRRHDLARDRRRRPRPRRQAARRRRTVDRHRADRRRPRRRRRARDHRDEVAARTAGDRVSVPEPGAAGGGADVRRRLPRPGRTARRVAARRDAGGRRRRAPLRARPAEPARACSPRAPGSTCCSRSASSGCTPTSRGSPRAASTRCASAAPTCSRRLTRAARAG